MKTAFLEFGDWKLYAIETANFRLDGGAMMGTVPKVMWEEQHPADELNRIEMAMRCLLLDTGDKKVLIETGIGTKEKEKVMERYDVTSLVPEFSDLLLEYNTKPEDISHVIISHLHFDHVGGATEIRDDKLRTSFPNAKYFVHEQQWRRSKNPTTKDRPSFFPDNIDPIELSGQLELLKEDCELIPGLRVETYNGHTEGMLVPIIEHDGLSLEFAADLIPLYSHIRPAFIMAYDIHGELTLKEKLRNLQDCADNNRWIFFYHDPDTIAARIRKDGNKFVVTERILQAEN